MYMMLAFLCRQTPAGNGTIQGRDCYHNNSRSHRSSSGSAVETHVILTFRHKRRKRATVARHWITFLVKCNFAAFHLMYSSLCLKAGAFHVLNSRMSYLTSVKYEIKSFNRKTWIRLMTLTSDSLRK